MQSAEQIRAIATSVVKEFVASGELAAQATSVAVKPAAQTTEVAPTQSAASTTEGVDFDEDASLGGLFDGAEIAA